jgi:hypothetical protein
MYSEMDACVMSVFGDARCAVNDNLRRFCSRPSCLLRTIGLFAPCASEARAVYSLRLQQRLRRLGSRASNPVAYIFQTKACNLVHRLQLAGTSFTARWYIVYSSLWSLPYNLDRH